MLDWRQAVDEMRHLTRLARDKGDNGFSLTEIDNYLDHISTTFTQIENNENKEIAKEKNKIDDFDTFIEKQKELITSSYTQGHHLTTVIIFGGYAALFTLWNFTKEIIHDWQTLLIALFITVSMTLYISIEIYGSWRRGREAQLQLNELNNAKKLNKFPDNFGQAQIDRTNKFMKVWHFFFLSTSFFAFLAAFLLAYSFIAGLFCKLI